LYTSIRDDILACAGYESLSAGLKDLNLQGIELFVAHDDTVTSLEAHADAIRLNLGDPQHCSVLQAQLAAVGAHVSALCMGNNFNADNHDEQVQWAVRTVHSAHSLGIPAIRIDAIMSHERTLPLETRQQIAATAIREILDLTEDTEVELGIENHGLQGNDPEFLRGLLELVDSPRLGLTLDSGNFYWRGWPLTRVYEIFEEFAPHVKHTHIKNIGYPVELREIQREIGYEYGKYACPIPAGDIDHAKYVNQLRAVGYKRDLCIEDESLGRYTPSERQDILRKTVQYLDSLIGVE
jgi:sugar phosphate isomerase/epimerase